MPVRNKYDIANERIEIVAQFIIRGASRSAIIRTVQNPDGKYAWDIGDNMIDKYISRAKALIRKQANKSEKDLFAIAMVRYDDLYMKNYQTEDFKECRAIQDSVNKLVGLNAPDKIDATTKGESLNKGFYELFKEVAVKKDDKD